MCARSWLLVWLSDVWLMCLLSVVALWPYLLVSGFGPVISWFCGVGASYLSVCASFVLIVLVCCLWVSSRWRPFVGFCTVGASVCLGFDVGVWRAAWSSFSWRDNTLHFYNPSLLRGFGFNLFFGRFALVAHPFCLCVFLSVCLSLSVLVCLRFGVFVVVCVLVCVWACGCVLVCVRVSVCVCVGFCANVQIANVITWVYVPVALLHCVACCGSFVNVREMRTAML